MYIEHVNFLSVPFREVSPITSLLYLNVHLIFGLLHPHQTSLNSNGFNPYYKLKSCLKSYDGMTNNVNPEQSDMGLHYLLWYNMYLNIFNGIIIMVYSFYLVSTYRGD